MMPSTRTTFVTLGVVATIAAAAYTLSQDRPTPPTDLSRRPEATRPLAFPVDPQTLLAPGGDEAHAAEAYRAIAADATARPRAYERVARDRERGAVAAIDAMLDRLVAARSTGEPSTNDASLIGEPAEIVRYGDAPPVVAIAQAGRAAVMAGLWAERADAARAEALYDATFSLGARLATQRWTWREFAAGIELMSTSGAAKAELLARTGRAAEAEALRGFLDAQRDAMRDRWTPLFEALATNRGDLIARHNGDLVAIATSTTADRMLRVEAILKLGRLRFNVGTPPRAADQRRAERTLDALAASERDPIVRRAIEAARSLSVEGFRSLR